MAFLRRDDDDFLPPEPKPERPPRSRFRLSQGVLMVIAFVVTFLVALACSLAFIVPALRPDPASAQQEAAPTPDYSQPTAREAYVPALELAREADVRAQLMSAAGVWSSPVNVTQLESGRNGWTFFFYLPSTEEMMTVTVGQNGEAEVISVEPWEAAPSVFDDERWRTDSAAAMALLLRDCGETLQQAEDAQVELRLSPAQVNRTMLWKGAVLGSDGAPLCEVDVDAVTGLAR